MSLCDDLKREVGRVIEQPWEKREGRVVPQTSDVSLSGGAVTLDATFLYADMAASSRIVKELDRRIAAKVLKAFHVCVCLLVRSLDGEIVSFDGDRVLGVFVGSTKNMQATKCGLHINYAMSEIIRPSFASHFDGVRDASFRLSHGVGIDTGTILAVRAGIRGDNDLIWIGRAPNLAAKLSELRHDPYRTFITSGVYNELDESCRYGGESKSQMWDKLSWEFLGESITLYGSNWWWKP